MNTIIEQIKAEIERQQKENVNYDENGGFASYCDHSTWLALESMLTFVSGLEESEKSIDGLEEEIKRWWGEEYMKNSEGLPILPVVQGIARHFAKWGAEHLKK